MGSHATPWDSAQISDCVPEEAIACNIHRMKHSVAQDSAIGRYITMDEAAAIAHVTRRTITRWWEQELFESFRPIARGSGRRLIDRASFLKFLGIAEEAKR